MNTAPDTGRFAPAYIGRFAPSPTGPLHFGSLVAALGSWLDARAAGGRWRVRMEDIDRPRCVPGAADAILHQLADYGLHWDGEVLYQSSRDDAYERALHWLRESGLAYPCACTRSQLASAQRNAEGETIYPGTCRSGLAFGQTVRAWRVNVTGRHIQFADRVFGELAQALETEVGDFIVRRADNLFAYQLAVVVDDAFQGITHIVRGADLLWNTPRQIYLQTLFGFPTPAYAHLPIITNAAGQKLSKQTRASSLPERGQSAVLTIALQVLGHSPPSELAGAAPETLLTWASTHWRIENVPARQALAPPQGCPGTE